MWEKCLEYHPTTFHKIIISSGEGGETTLKKKISKEKEHVWTAIEIYKNCFFFFKFYPCYCLFPDIVT